MLKPALARGELQCVGASTLNEYRKYIEKDGALERRFQPIIIDPPSIEEAIEILKGIRKHYEDHHKIVIPDETLASAARLSERYITDRFLPDKAIDVIDEAGARARLATQVPPPEVADLKEKLEELARRRTARSATRTSRRRRSCATGSASCRARSAASRRSGSRSGRATDRSSTRRRSASSSAGGPAFPVARLKEAESERLVHMEDELHERVIGQDEAIRRSAARSGAAVRGSRTRTGRSAASSSAARRASARRSWRARSRSSCSRTATR
jgi:ATP-dependent Clp protease ATP-binding subunit ClpC